MDPSELLKIAMGSPSNIHTTIVKCAFNFEGWIHKPAGDHL